MFTGIIEELGAVETIEQLPDSARVTVRAPLVTSDAGHGASIAVNGVCLTVVSLADGTFTADVMRETLDRSSLGRLGPGDPVNLERPVRLQDRLGGHVVQGHVDGMGTVLTRTPGERWEVVRIALPAALRRYVVEKGSVTVDGVSLTVSAVSAVSAVSDARTESPWFEVSLIPTTLELTTLGRARPGSRVNLEVDVLAKYVETLLAHGGTR